MVVSSRTAGTRGTADGRRTFGTRPSDRSAVTARRCRHTLFARSFATLIGAAALLPATASARGEQEAAPSAGGAALDQVAIATAAGLLVTGLLIVLGVRHRTGKTQRLATVAASAARVTGMPPFVALPAAISTISLLTAAFGLYWDISLHIDNGRDPGPLANPSHYFILAGLLGVFAAGWISMILPLDRPSPAAVRVIGDWWAPLGGLLLAACGSFALLGFPLDDFSHRLFGQDVTLWGPTHLMMLAGAAMSLVAMLVLFTEGRLALRAHTVEEPPPARFGSVRLSAEQLRRLRLVMTTGGLLVGLSIFQGEFDFGVPQFSQLFQPALIAIAAGWALVCARIVGGRGAALAAVGLYLVTRSLLSALVGGVFGQTLPHFPLYLAEAALVEVAALVVGTTRPYRLAAVAGVAIGTLGTLAEFAWSHVWMPLPWPSAMLPEIVAVGLICGVAGAIVGAFLASGIRLDPVNAGSGRALARLGAAAAAVVALFAYLGSTTTPDGARVLARVTTTRPAPERWGIVTVRVEPAVTVRDPNWFNITSWQGKTKLRLTRLVAVAPGVWRSERPVPLYGSWKSMIRFHQGRILSAVPVYMPADRAIPTPEIPATATFARPFVPDWHVLQRERKRDVPGWLWGVAGLTVLALSSVLLVALAAGLVRLSRSELTRTRRPGTAPATAPAAAAPAGG